MTSITAPESFADANKQSIRYFLFVYPVVASLACGFAIAYTLYQLYDFLWHKINAKLYCSVRLTYSDDTFMWCNKYMQDKGLIKHDNSLRGKVKKTSGPWWEEIFKVKDDKAKPELEFSPGAGDHFFAYKGK